MGYPTTATSSPAFGFSEASGNGRNSNAGLLFMRTTARSPSEERAAGVRLTGAGDPGKYATNFSSDAVAPFATKTSESGSPYQGSATWRFVAMSPSATTKPVREIRDQLFQRCSCAFCNQNVRIRVSIPRFSDVAVRGDEPVGDYETGSGNAGPLRRLLVRKPNLIYAEYVADRIAIAIQHDRGHCLLLL